MAGKFAPGEVLTLRALAGALGTSVIPARDAVLRLVTERALEDSGRSVRVPRLTLTELHDIERFRIALEGEAAEMAATRATATELAAIKSAAVRADRTCLDDRLDRFLVANQEFHFSIYRAAHNGVLQSMIEALWLQIGPHLGVVVHKLRDQVLAEHVNLAAHRRLLAALQRRDGAAAREALAEDLRDSADLYWHHADGGAGAVAA